MSEKLYWLWLATRPNCGIKRRHALLELFGSPEAIWHATREQLAQARFLKNMQLNALVEKDLTYAKRIAADCERLDIRIVTLADNTYPQTLQDIPDAPLVLYVRGTLPDFANQLAISIVGTRKATPYGLHAARYFAGTLAQKDCIVVSGMALGIDGAANRAALEAGKTTVAVLGCGVDVCYPWTHTELMQEIIKYGAVISEYPPGTQPKAYHFPERNRIITGLSQGTLIIEAPKKSGALISADLALEQGRDVFAIPADINRPNSAGGNALIRQGAAELVQTPMDILSHYEQRSEHESITPTVIPWEFESQQKVAATIPHTIQIQQDEKRILQGSQQEKIVWCAIRDGQYTVDAIVEHTGLIASDVLTALTMLEIGAYVMRMQDGYRIADDVRD